MTGILFFHPRGILGHLIDICTHHAPGVPNVAHVAVVLKQTETENYVIESWAPGGVRLVRYPKSVGIFVRVPMRETALGIKAFKLQHAKYDWMAYPFLAIDGILSFFGKHIKRNPLENKKRWVCSELAVYLMRNYAKNTKWVDLFINNHYACWSPQRLANVVWKEIENK